MFTFAAISAWFVNNKRVLIYIGIGLLILVVGIGTYQCTKKEVKFDYETVNKINSENEKVRKEELQKVIEQNSEVIQTVDERTVISNEEIEQRQREVDKKVQESDKKIQEVMAQKGNVTSEELECILVPQNCK